jgi:TonB family protein
MRTVAIAFLLSASVASAQTAAPSHMLPLSIGRPHLCNDRSTPADVNVPTGPSVVSFVVTVDGEVKDPQITKSSGNAELDARATKCVLEWRYKPAQQDGQPVEAMTSSSIFWKIRGLNL